MPVSLQQVADRVGLSGCTVSKILNDKAPNIPSTTRDRVRTAARELGYVPNRFARSLGRRRTEILGLMISGLANPFFVKMIEAAEVEAARHRFQTLLDSAPSKRGTYGGHTKLNGWPVDGILMWTNGTDRLTDFLGPQGAGIPVVYIGGNPMQDVDAVYFDGYNGVVQAMEHLRERGHDRIAYLAPYPFYAPFRDQRYAAYEDMCARAGIEVAYLETPGHEETRQAGLDAARQILSRPASARPDAVICHNDVLAVGLNCGLRRAGVRIPDEIAVVGQDGILEGQFLVEPLTTVVVDVDRLCRQAVDLLVQRIEKSGPPEQQIAPVRLMAGATT